MKDTMMAQTEWMLKIVELTWKGCTTTIDRAHAVQAGD